MHMTIKDKVAHILEEALQEAHRRELLPAATVSDITVERPQKPNHGDLASSTPLKLARSFRLKPMDIAEKLVPLIPTGDELEKVWAAPPGFINFSLTTAWLLRQVEDILQAGDSYGSLDIGVGQKVQVEFVSVNPTGPTHVGHARGGVLGSALSSILSAAGYQVECEYYVNDAGSQMEAFYRSLYVRYLQEQGKEAQMPENGYMGDYMVDLAREVVSEEGTRFLSMPEEQAIAEIGKIGLDKMMKAIEEDLGRIRVTFDVWFSERSLFQNGQYKKALEILNQNGHTTERDGATWFASTALGEDKDNVLIRSTGVPTYFASDVAYHYNKLVERGFDRVIDIWGADHQGHVPRMKAVVGALGVDPDRLVVIISQLVALKRGKELVRASKRTGELVTLRELIDEVGPDACRFFFLSRSAESQMDFDLELAKKQSSENPVYYIQYAHARIVSILRLAAERSIDFSDGDVSLLTDSAELDMIRKMVQLPELIEMMARSLEPHHLTYYSLELATAFHWFYKQCRVVSSVPGDEALTKARLKLVDASRIVLARCLDLMGMAAPEEM